MDRLYSTNVEPKPRWQLIDGCEASIAKIGLIHSRQVLLENRLGEQRIGMLDFIKRSDELSRLRDVEIFVIANKIVRNDIGCFRGLADQIIEQMTRDDFISHTLSNRFLQVTGITTRLNSAN